MKITLNTKTYCGINYGHTRWTRHLGTCNVCSEQHAKMKADLIANWDYKCECGCGNITNYGNKRINGHGATGSIKTEEQKRHYKEAWTSERKMEKSIYMKKYNPMFLEENKLKFRGDKNPSKQLGVRKKISENNAMKNPTHRKTQKDACNTPEFKKKVGKYFRENNPAKNKKLLEKRIKTYCTRLSNGEYNIPSNVWKTGYYNGTWYDSSLELKRMQQLDELGLTWTKKHGIRIPYVNDDGLNTYYIPDFLIEGKIIEEVKGWLKDTDIQKADIACRYCKENGYTYRFLLGTKLEEKTELGYYD